MWSRRQRKMKPTVPSTRAISPASVIGLEDKDFRLSKSDTRIIIILMTIKILTCQAKSQNWQWELQEHVLACERSNLSLSSRVISLKMMLGTIFAITEHCSWVCQLIKVEWRKPFIFQLFADCCPKLKEGCIMEQKGKAKSVTQYY